MTVYRRPDPIPLRDAMPAHGGLPPHHIVSEALPVNGDSGLLSGSVATKIVRGLLDGNYVRGGILWTEPQLCAAFGVSRTALREAVKILSAKGIVETRRKRGTAVLPTEQWNLLDPEVIGWLNEARPEQTARELRQMLDILLAGIAASETVPGDSAVMERVRAIGNRFLIKLATTILHSCDRADESSAISALRDYGH